MDLYFLQSFFKVSERRRKGIYVLAPSGALHIMCYYLSITTHYFNFHSPPGHRLWPAVSQHSSSIINASQGNTINSRNKQKNYSLFSISQVQQNYQQIVRRQCCLPDILVFMSECNSSSVHEWNIDIGSLILPWKSSIWFIFCPRI